MVFHGGVPAPTSRRFGGCNPRCIAPPAPRPASCRRPGRRWTGMAFCCRPGGSPIRRTRTLDTAPSCWTRLRYCCARRSEGRPRDRPREPASLRRSAGQRVLAPRGGRGWRRPRSIPSGRRRSASGAATGWQPPGVASRSTSHATCAASASTSSSRKRPTQLSRGRTWSGSAGLFTARYGNIYTSHQLLQLLRRTYGTFVPQDNAWTEPDG